MPDREILDSWKEIADYLGRSRKTCLRWEKELGLPVHRYEDSPKARVFAYKDEIDLWRDKTQHSDKKPFLRKSILKRLFIPIFVVTAILVISLSVYLIKRQTSQPSSLPNHEQITFIGEAYCPALSPDGKFLAYVDIEDYQTSEEVKLIVKDLLSGQLLEVLRADRIRYLKWTPDGAEITAVVDQNSVIKAFKISRIGGAPQLITPLGLYIAWSPDGSQYACTSTGLKEIRIHNKSIKNDRIYPLDGPILFVRNIEWSPKGNLLLVLTGNENNLNAIWTIGTDGNNQCKVFETTEILRSPQWSSGGDAIYFLRGKNQLNSIWKIPVSPESGKPINSPRMVLSLSGLNLGIFCSISSDGRLLAYTHQLVHSNIFLAKTKGKRTSRRIETKQLTSGTFFDNDPDVSPDKTLIAFSRGDGKTSNIYTVPIEGGMPKQLTFLNSMCKNPVWSSDGKWIAFGSNDGGSYKVWKVNSKGGRPTQFTKSKLSGDCGILWHPRSFILYQKDGNRNFNMLNPETEEEKPLVDDESTGWIFWPSYSPDGKMLAVFWNRIENREEKPGIWIISLEDLSKKMLCEGNTMPIAWSTDGNWIHALDRDTWKYLKINLTNSQVEELPVEKVTIKGKTLSLPLNPELNIILNLETLSDVWIVKDFDPEIE